MNELPETTHPSREPRKTWGARLRLALAIAFALSLASAQAHAIAFILGGVNGQVVTVGDQIAVTVTLDTESTTGIQLSSVAVLFDDNILSYNQAASTTTSYLLYGGRARRFLYASSTCGGYPQTQPGGCSLRIGTTNQVNVDFLSTDLSLGTENTGVALMATLIFDVVAPGDGLAEINLSITAPGNFIGVAGGGTTTATLSGGGAIEILVEPRFEACADGQTVADTETGLLWERKTGTVGSLLNCSSTAGCPNTHDVNNIYQWSNTGTAPNGKVHTDFLASLNTAPGFDGHIDWRLPVISELQGIMIGPGVVTTIGNDPSSGANTTGQTLDCPLASNTSPGTPPGCIDPRFALVGGPNYPRAYWSMTEHSNLPDRAWQANFIAGVLGSADKTFHQTVRAVRDGSCRPDSDSDGLSDAREAILGTDPQIPDSDGDGLNDGADGCPISATADQCNDVFDSRASTSLGGSGSSELLQVVTASDRGDINQIDVKFNSYFNGVPPTALELRVYTVDAQGAPIEPSVYSTTVAVGPASQNGFITFPVDAAINFGSGSGELFPGDRFAFGVRRANTDPGPWTWNLPVTFPDGAIYPRGEGWHRNGAGVLVRKSDRDFQFRTFMQTRVDCIMGDWGPWSACSETCGGTGLRSRTRSVIAEAVGYGISCTSLSNEQFGACTSFVDGDGDQVCDLEDNCPEFNPDQLNTDADDQGNVCDTDDDNDGLLDADEAIAGTLPLVADTDGDGLSDGDEVNGLGTNPVLADSDGDGLLDGADLAPLDGADCRALNPQLRLVWGRNAPFGVDHQNDPGIGHRYVLDAAASLPGLASDDPRIPSSLPESLRSGLQALFDGARAEHASLPFTENGLQIGTVTAADPLPPQGAPGSPSLLYIIDRSALEDPVTDPDFGPLEGFAFSGVNRFNKRCTGEVGSVFIDADTVPLLTDPGYPQHLADLVEKVAHETGHLLGLRHVLPDGLAACTGDPAVPGPTSAVMDYYPPIETPIEPLPAQLAHCTASPGQGCPVIEPPDCSGEDTGEDHNPLYHYLRYVVGDSADDLTAAGIVPGTWDKDTEALVVWQVEFSFLCITCNNPNLPFYNFTLVEVLPGGVEVERAVFSEIKLGEINGDPGALPEPIPPLTVLLAQSSGLKLRASSVKPVEGQLDPPMDIVFSAPLYPPASEDDPSVLVAPNLVKIVEPTAGTFEVLAETTVETSPVYLIQSGGLADPPDGIYQVPADGSPVGAEDRLTESTYKCTDCFPAMTVTDVAPSALANNNQKVPEPGFATGLAAGLAGLLALARRRGRAQGGRGARSV